MSGDAKVIYLQDANEAQAFTCAITESVDDNADGLIWHPFIYSGKWTHPVSGEFIVTEEHLLGMIEAFNAGIPTAAGIPIDEDAIHQTRGEGAFGWIQKLEIRDGVLFGGIKWNESGVHALTTEKLKFVSAHFRLNADSAKTYDGYPNVMFSCALCTRPFFYQQPELKVAASLYNREDLQTEVEQNETCESGGSDSMSEATVEVKTEVVETDPVVEVNATVDTQKVETPVASKEPGIDVEAALAERDSRIKELEVKAAQVDTLEKRLNEVMAQFGISEEERVKNEIAASMFGDEKPAPSAIEVLASATLNPCAETVACLIEHLKENGGKLALVEMGEKAIAASASVEPDADIDVSGLQYGDALKARIAEIAKANKCTVEVAEGIALDEFNKGKL